MDVASVVGGIVGGKAGTTTSFVTLWYKYMSEGKASELQGDLVKVLEKLAGYRGVTGSIGSIITEMHQVVETAEKDDNKKLTDLYNNHQLKESDTLTEMQSMNANLYRETYGELTWMTLSNGKREPRFISGTISQPDLNPIIGEFLITLAEISHGKDSLWVQYEGAKNYWRRSPGAISWQSEKIPQVAEKLNELKNDFGNIYTYDSRPPWTTGYIETRTRIIRRFADYNTGIAEIEIDWKNSVNVGSFSWSAGLCGKYTEYFGSRDKIIMIEGRREAPFYHQPEMWLYVTKAPGIYQYMKLPIVVTDGVGNKLDFTIELKGP
jgi:hypothetical protein